MNTKETIYLNLTVFPLLYTYVHLYICTYMYVNKWGIITYVFINPLMEISFMSKI